MSAANVLKFIKEKDAEFVDLRFTDPRGKLQHLTMDATIVDEDMIIQSLLNIVKNAQEAITTKGEIELKTRVERNYTINSQLLFEVLKMNIRGKTIAYSTYVKNY